jgi:alpha-1,3-mannosyltransferase
MLSYPAGHVYVYRALHRLTDSGLNIRLAQGFFSLLYTASVALTCAIYLQANSMPNYVLLLLPLSKRLHSIYILRLFNDCWSVVAMQASILAFGADQNILGTILFR